MNENKLTILVVDDNEVNCNILRRLLQQEYNVEEARNGKEALEIINNNNISAILLDLIMPVMDGYTFLKELKKLLNYEIPIIVTTASDEKDSEKKAFDLGVWDFISKPYDNQVLKYRLQSAIARSESIAIKKMKHMSEHDSLTGLHNRKKFFEETEHLLKAYPNEKFFYVSFDIDRFALINTFFGNQEGDKLLKCIASRLSDYASQFKYTTYGRIEADQFALCCDCEDISKLQKVLKQFSLTLDQYSLNFEIILTFGIYEITDRTISARQMQDYANLAAKQVKGRYSDTISIYDEKMGQQLIIEQEVINEMNTALEQEQFCVYIQPKYDLHTNLPAGGEVLVRWNHPIKGIISPIDFIPIFEKNGFITKLDYYVWEKACCLLKEMSDNNTPLLPISVNVSRVHLYNPQLTEVLCQIVDKYNIPHELFNLELTESIYTENPLIIQESIAKLHKKNFIVMMDDFGSGYSSLNVLKDVEFDVLKIDMRFFENSSIEGRGENIIASIIRMAKWLGLPTVAEGVENGEQAMFLRDMGCEYVQGYYFAKPMPASEYKTLLLSGVKQEVKPDSAAFPNDFWKNNSQVELLFSTISQPIALYEFADEKIEIVRVNKAFNDMFGYNDMTINSQPPQRGMPFEYFNVVLDAFHKAIDTKDVGECDYPRLCTDGKERWMHIHLKYVNIVAGKYILLGTIWDITSQMRINQELQRYKNMLGENENKKKTMLIVDDMDVNRVVLTQMFQDKFDILQAENGQQAKQVLNKYKYAVDIILLDLIMPVMDGMTFLQEKKESELMCDIPVVIITTDADPLKQVNMLELGANDYIAKPFVKEVAIKRVDNVLESSSRFMQIVKEYNNVLEASKKDTLTDSYNRTATEYLINKHLQSYPHNKHGFLILDVDNFREVNNTYGHIIGDEALKQIVNQLQLFFSKGDIIGRLGGDEFIVFIPTIESKETLLIKANELCVLLSKKDYTQKQLHLSVSIGMSISDKDSDFMDLYQKSDFALYAAKQAGKKQVILYKDNIKTSLK